jgi:hypothetical protein
MSADAADTPVKPRIPAITDTTKKINAHFRSVIESSTPSAGPAESPI